MNIRRFGPGHRRADRAAGSQGVLSSAIFSNDVAQVTEFTVTPGGTYGPLRSAGDVVLVVIEGGGWVTARETQVQLAAGESLHLERLTPYSVAARELPLRAILVELAANSVADSARTIGTSGGGAEE
jgi:quercetin dioxygenase-like cupin family protein